MDGAHHTASAALKRGRRLAGASAREAEATERGGRQNRERGRQRERESKDIPAFLLDVLLVLETGTAVTLFFTRETDLFFTEVVLSTRREIDVGGVRRVLTFPSGWLLVGEFDVNLFVGLLDGGLRFAVPIC